MIKRCNRCKEVVTSCRTRVDEDSVAMDVVKHLSAKVRKWRTISIILFSVVVALGGAILLGVFNA